MTNEEAKTILTEYLDMDSDVNSEYLDAMRVALKALESSSEIPNKSDDCISRESVIQIIENKLNPCTDMFKCLEMSEIKEDVEHLPPVSPKQRWIPCSIEKPQNGDRVIVTRHYGGIHYVETGEYEGGEWFGDLDEFKVHLSEHSEPIAWMPLPQPYKEESENQ